MQHLRKKFLIFLKPMEESFAYHQNYMEKRYKHLFPDDILDDKEMKGYVMEQGWLMVDILEHNNYNFATEENIHTHNGDAFDVIVAEKVCQIL